MKFISSSFSCSCFFFGFCFSPWLFFFLLLLRAFRDLKPPSTISLAGTLPYCFALTDETSFFYSAKARSRIFVEGEISTIFRLSDGVVMVAEPSSFVGVNKIYISGFFREASTCVEVTSEMRCECSSYTRLRGCHLHVFFFVFKKPTKQKAHKNFADAIFINSDVGITELPVVNIAFLFRSPCERIKKEITYKSREKLNWIWAGTFSWWKLLSLTISFSPPSDIAFSFSFVKIFKLNSHCDNFLDSLRHCSFFLSLPPRLSR